MTAQELVVRLHELQKNPGIADPEVAHAEADDALLKRIESTDGEFGKQTRAAFDAISKWYA